MREKSYVYLIISGYTIRHFCLIRFQKASSFQTEQALLNLLQPYPEGSIGRGFAALGEQFWQGVQGSLAVSGTA